MSGGEADPNGARRLRILGIAGSLRRHSLNRRLLEAARLLAPERLEIGVFDLAGVPLYNADLDNDDRRPPAVFELKKAISECDGILLATPEYNHGIPGVLKNAIDWASRPAGHSPLRDKPVAIIGAAPGAFGTVRVQQQLKLVLLSTRARLLLLSGVLVAHAGEKFDGDGTLVHAATREHLQAFLRELANLVGQ